VANRLAAETSAYLQQHADNPVDWYPWGEEPWQRARAENRPVLVSIGYSSCHWCHVMERESFENEETARLMNEHLICIKVDREERPDVDQIYMDAITRMAGQGGWPLNVFCTPRGQPFHGGTYFPPQAMYGRPSWSDVILAVARTWKEDSGQVEERAQQVMQALEAPPAVAEGGQVGVATLHALCRQLMQNADRQHGGFGGAPKFPTPTNLEAVLAASNLHAAGGDTLEHLVFSLKRMARGGIYDQLGGGFHRYSTDASWLVPHFEKMLYDNGQLLRVYAEAYRQTGDLELRWPVEETIDWLEREMREPSGGFFASQDADSEGEEGRFFVWNPQEIEEVLGAEAGREFCDAYGVLPHGNFERTGSSVLAHVFAGERARMREQRQRLLAARRERVAPETDRKKICAWIGYAIGGLATAGAAMRREDWLDAAARAADFALGEMSDEGRNLKRIHAGQQARIPAFLDDHAGLLCGLLDLHRAGGEDRYLEACLHVAEAITTRFYDASARDFFFAPGDDATLVMRPHSDPDGATPGAAGLATLGLARLAGITGRRDIREVVDAILETHGPLAAHYPLHLPTLVRTAALIEAGAGLGLILGEREDPRAGALAARARELLGPEDAVVMASPNTPPKWLAPEWLEGRTLVENQPTAYLCRGTACSLPARRPEELRLEGLVA
jgi:uncharacterized protein YyaL (SSP411 family)